MQKLYFTVLTLSKLVLILTFRLQLTYNIRLVSDARYCDQTLARQTLCVFGFRVPCHAWEGLASSVQRSLLFFLAFVALFSTLICLASLELILM